MSATYWTIIGPPISGRPGGVQVLCRCVCGAEREIRRASVTSGRSTSCGCQRADRDWSTKYEVDDNGCWLWLGVVNDDGYGKTNTPDGRFAHRVFYVREVGPIPDDTELDHLCRVRRCVNPEHLEPVSHPENCRRSSNAKFTPAQVAEIRAITDMSQQEIADRYGTTRKYIWEIRAGRSWRDEGGAVA